MILLSLPAIAIYGALAALGASMPDETLHYLITYKWGIIHKEAGTADLSLRAKGNDYRFTLTAATKPWADRIFKVRDTLVSEVRRSDLRPHRYVKISHEGGRYGRDELVFTYSGSEARAAAKRVRIDKKGKRSESAIQLHSTGPAFDMLSVFYFLRTIDYSSLSDGKSVKATIFSGRRTETLTIRCKGKERIKLRDGSHAEAWHILFHFTSGGSKTSDDIEAWISTDSRHIPLQLFGTLPLGQMRAYLTGR